MSRGAPNSTEFSAVYLQTNEYNKQLMWYISYGLVSLLCGHNRMTWICLLLFKKLTTCPKLARLGFFSSFTTVDMPKVSHVIMQACESIKTEQKSTYKCIDIIQIFNIYF